jgi:hypothetical protein
MLLGPSSLGEAAEDDRLVSPSLPESGTHTLRSTQGASGVRAWGAAGHVTRIPAFAFALQVAFSFTAKSFCVIAAVVNPATSASP